MKSLLLSVAFILLFLSQPSCRQITIILEGVPDLSGKQKVGIRGSFDPLSWEITTYLRSENGNYLITLSSPDTSEIPEYKFVIDDGRTVIWELDGLPNRILYRSGTDSIKAKWDIPLKVSEQELDLIASHRLLEDAEILIRAIHTLHPGLYRYLTEHEFQDTAARLRYAFMQDRSYSEAYLYISRFLADIRCGHTYANFFNQPDLIKSILLDQKDKLPFRIRWIGRSMVVTGNLSNADIPLGTEITSINGRITSAVLDDLLQLVKADGLNDLNRIRQLDLYAYNSFESLDVYLPLIIPPISGYYELEMLLPDGQIRDITVEAMYREERNRQSYAKFSDTPRSPEDTWKFEMLSDDIGYLKLGTFTVWNFEMDWKQFLMDSFQVLTQDQASGLILDIRGNGGGLDEVNTELLRYLLKEDCTLAAFSERSRYKTIPDDLRTYLRSWNDLIFDLSGLPLQNTGDYYELRDQPETVTYESGIRSFDGDLYVLMDASNSSATFYLSRVIRQCDAGILIGEPSGGDLSGINGGDFFFLNLPNTGIEVDIPVTGSFLNTDKYGAIQPDISVDETVDDIVLSRDAYIDAALKKIEQENEHGYDH